MATGPENFMKIRVVDTLPTGALILKQTLYLLKKDTDEFGSLWKSNAEGTEVTPFANPAIVAEQLVIFQSSEVSVPSPNGFHLFWADGDNVYMRQADPENASNKVWVSINNGGQGYDVKIQSDMGAAATMNFPHQRLLFIVDHGYFVHWVGSTDVVDNVTVYASANGRFIRQAPAGAGLQDYVVDIAMKVYNGELP